MWAHFKIQTYSVSNQRVEDTGNSFAFRLNENGGLRFVYHEYIAHYLLDAVIFQ